MNYLNLIWNEVWTDTGNRKHDGEDSLIQLSRKNPSGTTSLLWVTEEDFTDDSQYVVAD